LLGVTVRCATDSQDNVFGGPGAGNVISGNDVGVWLAGGGDRTLVKGNYIGTTPDGDAPLGNGIGITISPFGGGASNSTIGGTTSGEGNVIAFSADDGVQVDGVGSTGNVIRGNSIHSNGGDGVQVDGSTGNVIRGNSIHSNVGKGIENINGGNMELTPPTITAAGSASGTACANCTVDVYSDSADEGRVYHGFAIADGGGNWSFPGPVAGPHVTATATDANGNTSEFSLPFQATSGHDARLKKISTSSSVVLSDGTPDVKNIVIQVRNEGDHSESIGVYVDIVPPGGVSNPYGCTPTGRVINTIVTLAPGEQTTVNANLTFNCVDAIGAVGQTYTVMAAADAHADDGGACGPLQIQSMTCFNALGDDDNDSNDNRAVTNGFRVK